jgi:hypothetical protein
MYQGAVPYPWEEALKMQPQPWWRSRLQAVVLPYLARDPWCRPSAALLLATLQRVGVQCDGSNMNLRPPP